MRTIDINGTNGTVTAIFPTEADVRGVFPGGFAPNCFGRTAVVSKVTACRRDLQGRWFVHYYTLTESHGEMSCSLKQDEVLRSVSLTHAFTSAAIDQVEREAQRAFAHAA
jgi:hypothetical protein